MLYAGLLVNSLPGFLKRNNLKEVALETFSWVDRLPLPSVVCQAGDTIIIASNHASSQLLCIDMDADNDARYALATLLHSPISREDLVGYMERDSHGVTVGLRPGNGKKYSARIHVSRISPEPDELFLVQFASVQAVAQSDKDGFFESEATPEMEQDQENLSDNPFRILAGILGHLPIATCVTTKDGGFCWYCSEKTPELFGLSPEAVNQAPRWWHKGISLKDQAKLPGFWRQIISEGEASITLESRSSALSPIPQLIRWQAVAEPDSDGMASIIFHFFEMVEEGENNEFEDELVEDLVREFSGIARWKWNRKHQQVFWSPEFYQLHGLSFTAVPDISLPFPFISEETRFDFKLLLETLDPEHLPLSTEYQVRLEDGSERDFLLVVGNIEQDDLGKTEILSGFIQDKTELREMDRAQRLLVENLMKKQQILKEFSTAVSHRLRVPIAHLKGILNLVLNKADIPREQQLQILNNSAEELDQALHEMNQMLNMENGKEGGIPHRMRWQEIWKPVARDFQDQIIESKASLMVDFSGAKEVYANKDYLQGVLAELVNNALKFRDETRPLELFVNTEYAEGSIWFHFQDNGLGLNLNGREHSPFELYKKFHAGRSGKGFGLFMVKLWVDLLGGQISMTSVPGEGTRVSLGLPWKEEEEPSFS